MEKTNTPEQREFFDAIAKGQVETVQELIAANADLLQAYDYNCFGATPITRVCFNDDREMIKTLVGLGADINRRSDWSMGPWSPLHSAMFGRNGDLADFLLDSGATIDVHSAAGLGRIDDLKRLLDAHPDRVNESGGDGCQPLHFADSVEAAQLLLDRGADIEARCIDHYSTPVQYLADTRPQVAKFLFSKGATTDIFSAIMADDLVVVEKLIEQDPEVLNARISQEYFPPGPDYDVHNIMTFTIGIDSTPMHAAAKANLPAMVELLVTAGQSPDIRGGYDDASPLHLAAWNDSLEVAEKLVECGADIDARSGDIHNNSPAGWAIVAGSASVFTLLMDEGAKTLDWFVEDAQDAVNGKFREYKIVPQGNYDRILTRVQTHTS